MDRNWNYFRGPPALGVWPLSSEVPIGNGAEGTQGSVLRARALGQDEILHRATDSGKARGRRGPAVANNDASAHPLDKPVGSRKVGSRTHLGSGGSAQGVSEILKP